MPRCVFFLEEEEVGEEDKELLLEVEESEGVVWVFVLAVLIGIEEVMVDEFEFVLAASPFCGRLSLFRFTRRDS